MVETEQRLQTGDEIEIQDLPSHVRRPLRGTVEYLGQGDLTVALKDRLELPNMGALDNEELTIVWKRQRRAYSYPVVVTGCDDRRLTLRINLSQNRSYLRAPAHLRIEYRPLSAEEADSWIDRLRHIPSIEAEDASEGWSETGSDAAEEKWRRPFMDLAAHMDRIEEKVNDLLDRSQGRTPESEGIRRGRLRDVSASGLCFFSDEELEPGQLLLLSLPVALPPRREVTAVGQVVRREETSEAVHPWRVGVHIVGMHPDDREQVFRFIACAERRMLRERTQSAG